MALYTQDSIDRVKEAVDMVELVSARTDLRKVGQRWTGLCPFHDERTPSFGVLAEKGLYHCFGCGESGDAIKFVRETEGLDFVGALEVLADRYNVELKREEEDPEAEARRQRKAPLARPGRPRSELLRARPVGFARGRARPQVPGRPRAGRGGAARFPSRVLARRLGQADIRRAARRLPPRGASVSRESRSGAVAER